MSFKVSADYRCPTTHPYGVVNVESNELVSYHRSRAEAHAAVPSDVQVRVSSTPFRRFEERSYDLGQWRRACVIDRGVGDPNSKARYALPVREPNGALNVEAVRFAGERIDQIHGVSEVRRNAAARELVELYGQINEDPPQRVKDAALMPVDAATQLSNRSVAEVNGDGDDKDKRDQEDHDGDDDQEEQDAADAEHADDDDDADLEVVFGGRSRTVVEERASTAPWNGDAARYTADQYRRACLIDKGTGDPNSKDRYALPVREPSGQLNVNGVEAAAQRLGQVQGVAPDKKQAAARKLIQLYSQFGKTPPDSLKQLAGSSDTETRGGAATLLNAEQAPELLSGPLAPIEFRSASVANVDFNQRIITAIAAPYEQAAPVMGGQGFGRPGEIWQEIFCRSAFSGIERSPHRVRVNRDHDKTRTCGKVLEFRDEPQGLLSDVRIARTPLGDETLALADEGILGASVGMAVRSSDHDLDRYTKTRRIRHAYMDHLSFVPDPAYVGAEVLSVRDAANAGINPGLAAASGTPGLDEIYADPVFRWANERLGSR